MKTTTKLLATLFTAAALFLGTNVKAQTASTGLRFGIGLDALVPVGNLEKYTANFGLGITPRLQYGVSNSLAFTFTSGYYQFFPKTINLIGGGTAKANDKGIVPVKVGLKAFISKNIYLGAETGVGFEVNDGGGDAKFIVSPAIGYASKKWDLGFRYENFSGQNYSYGTLGLRLAYGFGL